MKVYRPLFFIIGLLLIIGMACNFVSGGAKTPTQEPTSVVQPTNEVVPTVEVLPTQETLPTVEALPTDTPGATGQDYFTEKFDAPLSDSLWAITLGGENQKKASYSAKNNLYTIDLEGANTKVYVEYLAYNYTDVRVDVTTYNRGKNTGAVLLFCRASKDGWYQVQIANDGRYWIQAFDNIGIIQKGINLIANGGSTHIKSGREKNDYGLSCSGDDLTLIINGVEERTIKDTKFHYLTGHVGFGLEAVNLLPIITDFENFQISKPQ
ncbi:MAG: hypothetical protein WA821_12650 [Anaerolineales bacterium]